MPRRRNGRGRYMRDRAERRMRRYDAYDRMDYRNGDREYSSGSDFARGGDRYYPQERYMEFEQPRERSRMYDYDYDMRRGRRDRNDYRDYADDDYDKEYHKDLKKWTEKLKKYDRFNMPKEQIISSAKQMDVDFEDYDEDEFYTVYLMHVSDYPTIANEPRVYLTMAKAWLEDKDIKIEPSEKLCKYMYEIAMAEEDEE